MKTKLLISLCLVFSTFLVYGQTFTVDGIKYEVTAANEVKVIPPDTAPSGAVIIPESVNNSGTDYAVTAIDNNAFENQFGIDSVTIPNSVISIGNYAFNGCIGMSSLTIGNSVNSIGEYAFQSCISLNSISLPDSLQIISDKAFQSCTGFLTLTIPDSVTSIGDSAFYGCSGLTTISIGSLASSIDEYAFGLAGADATLTEVQCAVPVPPTINANVFSNRDLNSSSLIVASGSLSAYQVASVWSSFGTISGTLSVEDIEGLSSLFQIYPNPSNGILYLNNKFNLEFSNIEIYNLQGSKVKSFDTQNFNDQIDVSNLKTGIYIIQLNTKKGSISKQLILNE